MQSAVDVILARRPVGAPRAEDFGLAEVQLRECGRGEVALSTLYFSIDPYVRCMLDESSPYGGSLALGDKIVGDAVSVVCASRSPDLPVGSLVVGRTGWTTSTVVSAASVRQVSPAVEDPALFLSALGNTGLTAFIGVTEIAKPRIGETVLVTGACGGVGSVAIQLFELAGCKTIGVAGGQEKGRYLQTVLGVKNVVDYKSDADISESIARVAPNGIDIFFDNVGGVLSEKIYAQLANHARVVLCGEVSQYNSPGGEFNPRLLGPLMAKRASISAFLVSDYREYFSSYRRRLLSEIEAGRLIDVRDVVVGIHNAPAALIGLLNGDNKGKRLVRIAS